jgi:ribosomal protein S18 acetylase RimI-like enzyme
MSTTGRPSPTLPSITRYPGTTTLTIADHLRQAYAEVFSQPTWNEDHTRIEEFRHQLDTDAHRPGFRAVVATGTGPTIDGFATGWITRTPFPTGRSYDKVTDQLGPQRVNELLVGALEVNELAVRPHARRRGLGRNLLLALTSDAPEDRAWLLTHRDVTSTIAFYRSLDWRPIEPLPGTTNDIAVFLSP